MSIPPTVFPDVASISHCRWGTRNDCCLDSGDRGWVVWEVGGQGTGWTVLTLVRPRHDKSVVGFVPFSVVSEPYSAGVSFILRGATL